jgi:hypothetical protein
MILMMRPSAAGFENQSGEAAETAADVAIASAAAQRQT